MNAPKDDQIDTILKDYRSSAFDLLLQREAHNREITTESLIAIDSKAKAALAAAAGGAVGPDETASHVNGSDTQTLMRVTRNDVRAEIRENFKAIGLEISE